MTPESEILVRMFAVLCILAVCAAVVALVGWLIHL